MPLALSSAVCSSLAVDFNPLSFSVLLFLLFVSALMSLFCCNAAGISFYEHVRDTAVDEEY